MFNRFAFPIGILAGTLFAAVIQLAPAVAQSPAPALQSVEEGARVTNCMVAYNNKTRVPAEKEGTLKEMNFEEGMLIKKGDVIAVVDDAQALLAVKLKKSEELEAKLQAQNDVNYRDAIATEAIASAEAKTYEDLYDKGAAPYWEMKKKRAEADRAKLRIELAELNEDSAMAAYMAKKVATELAESDIGMRTIRAPYDAFIEKRIAQLGEWVQPGSPIVEIVQMDRVRVEGRIDALRYAGQLRRGTPVTVDIAVGGTSDKPTIKRFKGTLDFISTDVGINKRHRIWVGLPNERVGDDWLIKPGMSAEITIPPMTGRPGGELY